MQLPIIQGTIDRRLLVNFRVAPEVLRTHVPAPFQPQLLDGWGIAGICLIRLKHVRPRGMPAWLGASSENAAHRIAVEWDEQGERRRGVYVARRDTNSRFNVLAGGRIFPGEHHHATFTVDERHDEYSVAMQSDDGETSAFVRGRTACDWPASSIFQTFDEASAFFAAGSLGYSPRRGSDCFEGLELCCDRWPAAPLDVTDVRSSFFDDKDLFPTGSVEFDSALVMRDIEHQWRQLPAKPRDGRAVFESCA